MDVFLKLLIAHIITDFFIQPNSWVKEKKRKKHISRYMYLHVVITGLFAWIFLWDWSLWNMALFITSTHLFIDIVKVEYFKDNLLTFVIDQICHIIVLCIVALNVTDSFDLMISSVIELTEVKYLVTIAGYLLVLKPIGYLVGKFTYRWRADIETGNGVRDSLAHAGIWIGMLERILVVTFVIFDQLEAIGFLIAAKSILRFSDKSEDSPGKQTEYVLIGTLISFTIALFVGLIIKTYY